MPESPFRARVWTEGLTPELHAVSGEHTRIDRGLLDLGDLTDLLQQTWERNEGSFEARYILSSAGKELELVLTEERLTASDPRDANYQNLPVQDEDLPAFLLDFFPERPSGRADADAIGPHWRDRILTGIVFVVLILSLGYVGSVLTAETSFLPPPEGKPIKETGRGPALLEEFAGFYVSELEDGGMAIELLPKGTFAFYDIVGRPGSPLLSLREVTGGTHEPVLIDDDIAIATDTNFVFQPITRDGLVFLQRRFKRIAKSQAEIPRIQDRQGE